MGLSSKQGREYIILPAFHHTEVALIYVSHPQRCDLSECVRTDLDAFCWGGKFRGLRDTGLVHTTPSGLQQMPDFIGFL